MLVQGNIGQYALGQGPNIPPYVGVDWTLPYSDPVGTMIAAKSRGAFVALAASGIVYDPLSIGTTLQSPDMWAPPWSEPVRLKPGLGAIQQDWSGQFPQTAKETVTFDRWAYDWSLPVRIKPGLTAADQFVSNIAPIADEFRESSWQYAWSEPVRVKPRLIEAAQQVEPDNPFAMTVPESVSEDRWHQPWSDPVRVPLRLVTGAQLAFATSPTSLTAKETVTEDRWHQPWSDPRVRPTESSAKLSIHLMPSIFDTRTSIVPELTLVKWYSPFSEPVRIKPGLVTDDQAFLALTEAAPFPEMISYDKWGYAWSEPVRVKPGLTAPYQGYFIPTAQWYGTARTRTVIIN